MNDDFGRGQRGAMLALTLLLVLAVVAEALIPSSGDAKPSRRREVGTEIIGGKAVPQGKLPFMTYVEVENGSLIVSCGGSLINPLFVLTAAHCVVGNDGITPLDPSAFTLVIGRADLNGVPPANLRGVTQVTRHPDFNPATFANDVAGLKLDTAVPESIARPLRMVRPNQRKVNQAKKKALVAGWGVTNSGETTDRLQEATLKLVSSSSCSAAYGAEFQSAIMLCAAFPGRDSCQGDSGGPLIVKEKVGSKRKKRKKGQRHRKRVPIMRNVQSGIVSFGEGCANPGFPGVYTRLTAPGINDFIIEVVSGA